jgi:hypothetical protein
MEIGFKSGMLTYVEDAPTHTTTGNYTYSQVLCKCDCGESVIVRKTLFTAGKSFSCGCTRRFKSGLHKSHIMAGTRQHHSWFALKSRCDDKTNIAYDRYGGRGITYTEKWSSFHGFWEDMGSTYENGLSIDRIDPNGNYCKENCRWATASVQAYNQRQSKANKSGKTGVHWETKSNKWRVKFTLNNNVEILGYYKYLWDAVYIRMQKEQEIYGYVKD